MDILKDFNLLAKAYMIPSACTKIILNSNLIPVYYYGSTA